MKPLETNRQVLTWLCILPADETAGKFKKWICIAFSCSLITTSVCGFISSSAFMLKFWSTNLIDCLYALFQVAANVSALYMMMIAYNLRHKVAALFDRLTEIYYASKKFVKYHWNLEDPLEYSQNTSMGFAFLSHSWQFVCFNLDSNETSFRFLAKANSESEWIWSIYFKVVMAGVVMDNLFTCTFSAIVCGMKYDTFNSGCLYLPYKTV